MRKKHTPKPESVTSLAFDFSEPKSKQSFTCETCQKVFTPKRTQRNRRFCSPHCAYKFTGRVSTNVQVTCQECGKSFSVKSSHAERRKFCSRPCCDASKKGHAHIEGYWVIRVGNKPVLQHRHIMAQHIGRPLLPTEVVHHIDGNKANNELRNLELLSSQSEHMKRHAIYIKTETHRQCGRCLEVKLHSHFYTDRAAYCRDCEKQTKREQYRANPEVYKARAKARRDKARSISATDRHT